MIVVIGRSGQLAKELAALPNLSNAVFLGRTDIDITSLSSVNSVLGKYNPSFIINASAYTAVDLAESEPDKAFAVNYQAVENLAVFCKTNDSYLVHVSTDYVFRGNKGLPYAVSEKTDPQGVYGASKAKGEKVILDLIPFQSCIIRTSWVYSCYGNNFVKTMLKLMQEKSALGIVEDQIGSPTWAKGLAQACVHAVQHKVIGVHHWTDNGVASWYDFSVAIQMIAYEQGKITKIIPIEPLTTEQYPTISTRPAYSVLEKNTLKKHFSSLKRYHWQHQLKTMLAML